MVVDEGPLTARALHALLPFRAPGNYFGLASGGIGFALPGAIGIQLAQPERPVLEWAAHGQAARAALAPEAGRGLSTTGPPDRDTNAGEPRG